MLNKELRRAKGLQEIPDRAKGLVIQIPILFLCCDTNGNMGFRHRRKIRMGARLLWMTSLNANLGFDAPEKFVDARIDGRTRKRLRQHGFQHTGTVLGQYQYARLGISFRKKTAFRRRRKMGFTQCGLDALECAVGRFFGVPDNSDTSNLAKIGCPRKTTQEFRQIMDAFVVMNLHPRKIKVLPECFKKISPIVAFDKKLDGIAYFYRLPLHGSAHLHTIFYDTVDLGAVKGHASARVLVYLQPMD